MSRACGTHGRGDKSVQGLVGKPEGNSPLGRPKSRWKFGIRMDLRENGWVRGGVDSVGSGYVQVGGSCKHGDELLVSVATDLVS
jgi:hypothetical protein